MYIATVHAQLFSELAVPHEKEKRRKSLSDLVNNVVFIIFKTYKY